MELADRNGRVNSVDSLALIKPSESDIFDRWKINKKNIVVRCAAIVALSGWVLCAFCDHYGNGTVTYVLTVFGLLPFLFDIVFTYYHCDMLHIKLSIQNAFITFLLLTYNALLLSPIFTQGVSFFIVLQYIGAIAINVNCSLTLLRIYYRCSVYMMYFKISMLPIGEVKTGSSNRVTNDNDLTYSILNIKDNDDFIKRTVDYLKFRLVFTGPLYFLNLIASIKADYYSGYIGILIYFIPISTPFLFLSLIVMYHNSNVLQWEAYHLIESECAIKIAGIKIRHAWFISFGSFLLVTTLKLLHEL